MLFANEMRYVNVDSSKIAQPFMAGETGRPHPKSRQGRKDIPNSRPILSSLRDSARLRRGTQR